MSVARRAISLAACFALVACVSFDPHYDKVDADAGRSASYDAVFSNVADVQAGTFLNGSKTLDDALAIPEAKGAVSVRVRHDKPNTLDLRFIAGDHELAVRHYDRNSGSTELPDHSLRIVLHDDCGVQHASQPIYGCGTRAVRLFLDAEGRLVVQEQAQGAGVAGILPYIVFVRDAVMFKHLEDPAPPPAASH